MPTWKSVPLVNAGERVEACQTLGAVGKSGNAGVAHLHLEMRRRPAGSLLTTMSYYTAEATCGEKASYLRWLAGVQSLDRCSSWLLDLIKD
jgi:murein DD-endopeptidase MepM/ murein hydrolase activator NlpD